MAIVGKLQRRADQIKDEVDLKEARNSFLSRISAKVTHKQMLILPPVATLH